MNKILKKKELTPLSKLFVLDAPKISRKHQPGQFIILRVDEKGERIPLTIADSDPQNGTITIICQEVGQTTKQLGGLRKGDFILDVAGPLGKPTHINSGKMALCIAGGYGVATINPILKKLRENKNRTIAILGSKSSEHILWEDQIKSVSDRVLITTDDGSKGRKGLVTDELKDLIKNGLNIDTIYAVGPIPMMNAVYNISKEKDITTYVSLNSIMIDGTGMCGSCRVSVGGKVKFVCIDGPEFEAQNLDFDELTRRNSIYKELEKKACCLCQ